MAHYSSPRRRELLARLPAFKQAWPARGWSWDRRFDCLASTFVLELVEEAQHAVALLYPHVWSHTTLHGAPPLVQDVAHDTGGVRPDQHLVSTDEVDGLMVYGLWWPWGGEGTNISMRVGLAGDPTQSEIFEMRKIFDALDD